MSVDTLERPTIRPKVKDPTPKLYPQFNVIVHNDDDHTFQYVVVAMQKVFKYSLEKSAELTIAIHEKGLAIVWTGSKEVAELKEEQIRSLGPDLFAPKKVDYPLRVTIEPVV